MTRPEVGLVLAACVAGAFLMSGSTLAGSKVHFPVLVDTAEMMAAGNLGSARNSGDQIQLLSCKVSADASGAWGFCVARNAVGVLGSCSTADPNMLATMRALGTDSYVQFSWNSAGQCTDVAVINGSETEPKR